MSGERHSPVMLNEVIAALNPRDGAIYVDGTFGGGGYSRALLEAAGSKAHLQVDGGVTAANAGACVAAGADALVAGTAVFRGGPAAYADNIRALKTA